MGQIRISDHYFQTYHKKGSKETGLYGKDRANAFESQYGQNTPQRCIPFSNRMKLKVKHPYI